MNNGHFFEHETNRKCQNDDFDFMWNGFTLHCTVGGHFLLRKVLVLKMAPFKALYLTMIKPFYYVK